ncbi:C2 domain-containing protein 3, partial [Ophiophagus hannah]
MTSRPEETSRGHEDGHRFSSVDQALRGQENGATRTQMLKAPSSNEFWNARVGEEPVIDLRKSPSAENTWEEDSAQSHSEEEYEEAIVEPRTLNEITTVTDKTSPWSSFLSETEQEPVHQAQMTKGGDHLPTERALRRSSVSDVIQEGPLSASSLAGSGNSPFGEQDGDNNAEEDLEADELEADEPQLEVDEEEPQLGAGEAEPQLGAGEEEPQLGAGEEEPSTAGQVEIQKVGHRRSTEVQEGGPPEATHNGGGDFVRARRVAPGVTEGSGNLPREPQQEEGTNGKGEEDLQLCPPSQEIMQQTEAFSGEDDKDLAEEFNAPIIPLYPFLQPSPLRKNTLSSLNK